MDPLAAAQALRAATLDQLPRAVTRTAATPRTVATALAIVFATLFVRKIYRALVPPRFLRKYPYARPWTVVRTMLQGHGYLDQHAILHEAMLQDAVDRGIIASKDEMPAVSLRWFLGRWQVLFANPQDLRQMLLKHESFDKTVWDAGYLRKFLGYNMAMVQIPEWKRQRKVINPAFHRGWNPLMFATPARQLIKHMDATAAVPGASLDISGWMQRMALDALSLAIFGTNMDSLNHPDAPMVATYNAIVTEVLDASKVINPTYKFNKHGKRARELIDTFDRYIFEFIEAKTRKIEEERRTGKVDEDRDSRDLLTMMIEAAEGNVFSREDLRANTIIFFMGGHDTTANALSFALYRLGMNPAMQDRARQEVISVMGDIERNTPFDQVPFPTPEQQRKMVYLGCCIKEVLRLHPSSANLPEHQTTTAVTLHDGTVLPKDTRVTGDIWALHRNRGVWGPDVTEFRPERFLDAVNGDGAVPFNAPAHDFGWAPFGAGQRICLGHTFSLMEQHVVLAMMLLRYEWTLVGDDRALAGNPRTMPGGILHVVGLQLALTRRDV
ncbi:hypothetical protein GGF31_005218 [Allomyces arbusculus]|nr:hypothetical protein GGF31_005218 [Allomyces arbusculus]